LPAKVAIARIGSRGMPSVPARENRVPSQHTSPLLLPTQTLPSGATPTTWSTLDSRCSSIEK
jgi:hypothetical protein